jgi:predicted nucleic acid-binding protein
MKRMSGNERVFVDTNVWLYAFVAGDHAKSAAAATLLQRWSLAVSVQIINEVCVNLKRQAGLNEADLRALIESFYARCLVVPLDQGALLVASSLRERYSLSFWDSTVVASALQCGAGTLYSEDMQHGLVSERKLRILNPFEQHVA